ncbi:hypothetical protein GQ53DRAFT_826592 [Thozetella sp. PMI_491]|nr:hypothetical protein GQ53DRAFT_826592 [Thozetella sp. PMI_491]
MQCDRRLPTCRRCEKLGRPCAGYKPTRKFFDESTRVRQRYSTANSQHESPGHAAPDLPGDQLSPTQVGLGLRAAQPVLPADATHGAPLPENRIDSAPYPVSARLIESDVDIASPWESLGTSSPSLPDDVFFDLDIETYYANGNNACGFIPGAPVVMNTDGLSMDELLSTEEGTTNWGGTENHTDKLAREPAILLRHFVEVIAPAMDIFDSDAYFSRHFPFKAKQNAMLRAGVAAVAAKQIAQMTDAQAFGAALRDLSPAFVTLDESASADWYYKAADYYDAGISILRLHLQRFCSTSSPASTVPHDPEEEQARVDTAGEPPNKRRRGSTSWAPPSLEDLLSGIAVFSLYESLNGYTSGWDQHVAGFQSLLRNQVLPRVPRDILASNESLSSIQGGRASFWNIARADFLAAYQRRSLTQLDPEDLTLWEAAGLRCVPATSPASLTPIPVALTNGDREEDVCRTLIWILAKSVNFLGAGPSAFLPAQHREIWTSLRNSLDQWHKNLPMFFQPYLSLPLLDEASEPTDSSASSKGQQRRISQLIFNVPMCAMALQLYHFVQIMLLPNWPMDESTQGAARLRIFRKISEESEYHSRQICGIALGLRNYPCLRQQMVEPLYLAGMCLEEEKEKSLIIRLLQDIQKETGHSTDDRIRNLLANWERAATSEPPELQG